jgi:hypothetical protein
MRTPGGRNHDLMTKRLPVKPWSLCRLLPVCDADTLRHPVNFIGRADRRTPVRSPRGAGSWHQFGPAQCRAIFTPTCRSGSPLL